MTVTSSIAVSLAASVVARGSSLPISVLTKLQAVIALEIACEPKGHSLTFMCNIIIELPLCLHCLFCSLNDQCCFFSLSSHFQLCDLCHLKDPQSKANTCNECHCTAKNHENISLLDMCALRLHMRIVLLITCFHLCFHLIMLIVCNVWIELNSLEIQTSIKILIEFLKIMGSKVN